MGFYLRKSIRVGPIRFNLSKSGIGVSAGVKGLRFGTGPHGNYVHMGRGGIYYRKTFSRPSGRELSLSPRETPQPIEDYGADRGVGPMVEIESGNVNEMVDSSSVELLRELDEKKRKIRLGPIVIVLTVICSIALFIFETPPLLRLVVLFIGLIWTYIAFRRDILVKTVVLFYGFDPELENAYALLHDAATRLASCVGHWHISASAKVYERKYHAGASALVERKSTAVKKTAPPFLKTNIETISIGVGKQTMYFFPDRVLIYESGKVGAVGYDQLKVSCSQTRFIEETAPSDAQVVDQTWRYVNKNGGPDRRFSNNRMLPICLYDEIHFASATGVNEIIQASRSGIGVPFRDAIAGLSLELLRAKVPPQAQLTGEISYRIGKDGKDLGDLPLSTVNQMLSRGELSMDDYYFDFTQNNWVTLRTLGNR